MPNFVDSLKRIEGKTFLRVGKNRIYVMTELMRKFGHALNIALEEKIRMIGRSIIKMSAIYGKIEIYSFLEAKGIDFEKMEHEAVYTMEDMDKAGITAKGTVCKICF